MAKRRGSLPISLDQYRDAEARLVQLAKANPDASTRYLHKLLKKEGYPVHISTLVRWMKNNRLPIIREKKISHSGYKRLTSNEVARVKKFIRAILENNPRLGPKAMQDALASKGFTVARGSIPRWIKSALKDINASAPRKEQETVNPVQDLTWEKVVQSVPSVEDLGALLLQGVISRITELHHKLEHAQNASELRKDYIDELKAIIDKKDTRISELEAEVKCLHDEYNTTLAKRRVGTLTLDMVNKQLVRKF